MVGGFIIPSGVPSTLPDLLIIVNVCCLQHSAPVMIGKIANWIERTESSSTFKRISIEISFRSVPCPFFRAHSGLNGSGVGIFFSERGQSTAPNDLNYLILILA